MTEVSMTEPKIEQLIKPKNILQKISENHVTQSILNFVKSDNTIMLFLRAQWKKFRNLKETHQLMTLSFVLVCLMAFGIFDNLIYHFICLGYPTHESFRSSQNSPEQYLWMNYWMAYVWITFVENIIPLLCSILLHSQINDVICVFYAETKIN